MSGTRTMTSHAPEVKLLTPTTIAVALIVVAAVAIGRTGARGGQAAQPASQQQKQQPLQVVSEAIRNPSTE